MCIVIVVSKLHSYTLKYYSHPFLESYYYLLESEIIKAMEIKINMFYYDNKVKQKIK